MLMASRIRGRRPAGLALDGVFFLWLTYAIVSGNFIPPQLMELIHPQSPVVAVVEPLGAPYDGDRLIELRPEA